jgi:Fe-S-cluster containining protein
MAGDNVSVEPDLPSVDFSSWLKEMQRALRGERSSDVPCGSCTACCTSSQFIHIRPDEVDTLAHISPQLLFPVPRAPRGHVLLGYDERGHCPMLIDSKCSIYEHRPQTCRTYDCRVFAAAGIDVGDEKPMIARTAARLRFDYGTESAEREHDAVRAAAAYISEHPDRLPEGVAPVTATQRAVLAVEIHGEFLGPSPVEIRKRLPPAR